MNKVLYPLKTKSAKATSMYRNAHVMYPLRCRMACLAVAALSFSRYRWAHRTGDENPKYAFLFGFGPFISRKGLPVAIEEEKHTKARESNPPIPLNNPKRLPLGQQATVVSAE